VPTKEMAPIAVILGSGSGGGDSENGADGALPGVMKPERMNRQSLRQSGAS